MLSGSLRVSLMTRLYLYSIREYSLVTLNILYYSSIELEGKGMRLFLRESYGAS